MAASDDLKFLAALKGKRIGGTINDWYIPRTILTPRTIFGEMRNDSRGLGRFSTSAIVELNEEEGWLETQNSLYSLGEKYKGS